MTSSYTNNARTRDSWIKILLFPLALLLLLTSIPAQAQSVGGCVANFGAKEGVQAVTIIYPIDFLPAS